MYWPPRPGYDYHATQRLVLVLAQALLGQGKMAEAEPMIALVRELGQEIVLEEMDPPSPED
jgi:hypothetical protein